MSRSYRHYSGGGHTNSHMKQGKQWKRLRHGQMRAQLKDDYEGFEKMGCKCHRANRYDSSSGDDELEELETGFKTEGYDVGRIRHKKFGK